MNLESARGVKRELEMLFASKYRSGARGKRRKFALGVAPGTTPTQYRIAVRAETEAELPGAALESIQKEAAGEVDLRFVGPIAALAGPATVTKGAAMGASVAHFLCSPGTLGFFARKSSDKSIGLVSNNHVIAAEDEGQEGDEILQLPPTGRAERPRDVIALLAGGYPRLKQTKAQVDCAFARLVEGKKYDAESLEAGLKLSPQIADPNTHPQVSKFGRTTGLTHGRVSAFELDPQINYTFGKIRLGGQIEVEPTGDRPFACGGDSGSLVFTRDGCHPVGLLCAASVAGGPSGFGLAYANPIDVVLSSLGVTFLT